jgi:diamine N-acetyltransferase
MRTGCGRFAVEQLCIEARRRGQNRVTVLWVPHPDGPEQFYLRLGFTPTGQTCHGQTVAESFLDWPQPASPHRTTRTTRRR